MELRHLITSDMAIVSPSAAAIKIEGITSDSRKVQPGYLFAALSGSNANGAQFAEEAMARGANVILTDKSADLSGVIAPIIRVDDPRHHLALMASRFYERQPRTIVAVTGTAGKTSVASFTRQIWEKIGNRAAMIGTTGLTAPGFDGEDGTNLTTPDPVQLHKVLDELHLAKFTHCTMEASSHGLDQRRLDGVRLAAGAFTNLGRDHMDYHANVMEYMSAKMRLFDSVLGEGKPAVIFADDPFSDVAVKVAEGAGLKVLTVGRNGDFFKLKRLEQERFRQIAEVEAGGKLHRVVLPLAGEFQMYNALVAAALAVSTGTDAGLALGALETISGARGRLDLVGTTPAGAPVYVDYAHKPEALESVLTSVRPFTTGKIVVVFGCGGDRDPGKRPVMGEIAQRLADHVIVTDDNPRTENPAAIRQEILAGCKGAVEIPDRAEAIKSAVSMLGAGDCLIVAGKGHEEGQTIGNETLPFSDHLVVQSFVTAGAA